MELPVYLDNSATTPCDPRVVETMLPFFNVGFGNPASRFHRYGWEAEEAVDIARVNIARLIGAKPTEIVFTSGATESCNLVINGIYEGSATGHKHIITLKTEHKAVLQSLRRLEKKGCDVTMLGVNSKGLPDLGELEQAIKPYTLLIAAMYANNETGVVLPVKEIGSIAKKHGVPFFSDATQAAGKIPLDVEGDGIDLMAFTAHKMYGPKGVGALYIRSKNPRIRIEAQQLGGDHERGFRSGTLNVPGIVGFGKAAHLAQNEIERESTRLLEHRIKFEKSLLSLPDIFLNGDPAKRLPHVTNITVDQVENERLLLYLSSKLALSPGAACSSVTQEPSHVLKAMGLSGDQLYCALRVSLGRFTTGDQIDFAIDELRNAIASLRANQKGSSSIRLQPSSF